MTKDYLAGKGKQQVQGPCGRRQLDMHKASKEVRSCWRDAAGEGSQELSPGQAIAEPNANDDHKYHGNSHR